MAPRVFARDVNGKVTEQDWAWLESKFGNHIRVDPRPHPELDGWEITAVYAYEGPCIVLVTTVGTNGTDPAPGVKAARWWTNNAADNPPFANQPGFEDMATWHTMGVAGVTKEDGTVGFGMGGGDKYTPPDYRVSETWCEGNSGRSVGHGWLIGTNHGAWHPVYQWTKAGDEPPPPDEDPIAAAIYELARQVGRIADNLP